LVGLCLVCVAARQEAERPSYLKTVIRPSCRPGQTAAGRRRALAFLRESRGDLHPDSLKARTSLKVMDSLTAMDNFNSLELLRDRRYMDILNRQQMMTLRRLPEANMEARMHTRRISHQVIVWLCKAVRGLLVVSKVLAQSGHWETRCQKANLSRLALGKVSPAIKVRLGTKVRLEVKTGPTARRNKVLSQTGKVVVL
jgi:hypothetical protein